MSASARAREDFIAEMVKRGRSVELARAFLRVAATLDRLAVALCNGDWPCDNGVRKTKLCGECQLSYAPSAVRKDGRCVDCHAKARARGLCPDAWEIEFQGDPRGPIVTLYPTGRANERDRIVVPS